MDNLLIRSIYSQNRPFEDYSVEIDKSRLTGTFATLQGLLNRAIDFVVEDNGYISVRYYYVNNTIITHILEEQEKRINLTNLEYEYLLYISDEYTYIARMQNKIMIFRENDDLNDGTITLFDDLYKFIKDDEVYEIKYILDNVDIVSDL